jgi:DNA-binding NarL/FixJ family response regulator
MESARIRVAILEDQLVFQESLTAVLEGAGMEVVARGTQPAPFLARIRETLPHVVLVDLQLERLDREEVSDGLTVLQCLHDFYPSIRPVVLSCRKEPGIVEQCLRMGAAGYLCKLSVGVDEVVDAVRRVAQGERLMPPSMLPFSMGLSSETEVPVTELSKLTEREREVLGYIAAGADNLKIAACLGITERTVKAHITSIYKKLGPENRTQLAVLACQLGVQRPATV